MNYKTLNKKTVPAQLEFREALHTACSLYKLGGEDAFLQQKDKIFQLLEQVKTLAEGTAIHAFYVSLGHILQAGSLLVSWAQAEISPTGNAPSMLKAAANNTLLFDSTWDASDKGRPSLQALKAISGKIASVTTIKEVPEIIQSLAGFPYPVGYLTLQRPPWSSRDKNSQEDTDPAPPLPMISAIFYIDGEPWANPQLLKPNRLYPVTGVLRVNAWPQEYDKLVLNKVSTTDDSWFTLSLPEINKTSDLEIEVKGNISFKLAQGIFDPVLSIKLIAEFKGEGQKPIFPQIIGYDELIFKILDADSFPYPTGNDKLNRLVLEITLQIQKELPGIDKEELSDFLKIFSAILNYQGHCLESGEYKEVESLPESDFRDNLIRYLNSNRYLGKITKEASMAGGRVEINYKGIIIELKVDTKTASRSGIIEKYVKQATAYTTAAFKQLGILCVLDLSPKINPPALITNNISLVKPSLHGFEGEDVKDDTRIAVVIIDGNTPNPSKYKKISV